MAKNRDRKNRTIPELLPPSQAVPPPPPPPSATAQGRLLQQEFRRAEARLLDLMAKSEQTEARLDEKIRDANSLIKSLNDVVRKARDTVQSVERAIEFIAQEDVAEIIQTEVASGLAELKLALKTSTDEKVAEILKEFDHLRDVLHGVAGNRKPGAPNLEEIVAGVVADETLRRKQQ